MKSFILKGRAPTKAEAEAFARWVKDGTVTEKYLRDVLGDSMKSVCAFKPSKKDLEAKCKK